MDTPKVDEDTARRFVWSPEDIIIKNPGKPSSNKKKQAVASVLKKL